MRQYQPATAHIQMRVLQQIYTPIDDSELTPAVADRITLNTNTARSAFLSTQTLLDNNVATAQADRQLNHLPNQYN
jgi:hypothetical protein